MRQTPPAPPTTAPATPPPRGRLAAVSAIAALVGLVGLVAWFVAGRQSLASPGPVSAAHARVATACAACHEPWTGVTDARCARCHDPADRGTFGRAAHVDTARQPAAAAGRARRDETVGCARCHGEHQGVTATLAVTSDEGCRTCHSDTWATHPAFAVFDAPADTGGLVFSHAVHLPEVQKTLGRDCEACHRREDDAAAFDPPDFERDCASCHVRDGVLTAIRLETDRAHRDPAVLAGLAGLSEVIAPGALAARRGDLAASLARIEAALRAPRPDAGSAPDATPLARDWAARGIPVLVPDPSATDRARMHALEVARDETARRLGVLDAAMAAAGGPPARAGGAVAADAVAARDALVAPCLKCHELEGPWIRPVTGGRPRLGAASFTHAPHLRLAGTTCTTCHADIDRSGSAADVNLPRVTTCRTCHGDRADAPTACAACHAYHRQPALGSPAATVTPRGGF